MSDRQLATIRKIAALAPIEGADKIELALVDGWQVVVQKDLYKVGDDVIYLEIDSWVPNTLAPFLQRSSKVKTYNGVEGNRLKTIKLKGQLSQGLVLPMNVLDINNSEADLTTALGIQKWEKELSPQLAGVARGNFPSFLIKTDQERVQNFKFTLDDLQKDWEVTEKLDGSSMTAYLKDDRFGVCSRNIDLIETEGNTFWKVARKLQLEEILRDIYKGTGIEMALQGELIGPGIQGNQYNWFDHDFFIFDIFNITDNGNPVGVYLQPLYVREIVKGYKLSHVPVFGIHEVPKDLTDILATADGKSMLSDCAREGLVYKRVDGCASFKVISNEWLLKNE